MNRDPIEFGFNFIDIEGRNISERLHGRFNGRILDLGIGQVGIESILHAISHDSSLVIFVDDPEDDFSGAMLKCDTPHTVSRLKRWIDNSRSSHCVEVYLESLDESKTISRRFDAVCRCCHSTILLAGIPETPEIYCPYCATTSILAHEGSAILEEDRYRICDECGCFARIQTTSLFFFNTLFFLFWSSSWQKACCRVCMRKAAWLELFANILGFIGIPVALAHLFDCYFGADKNIGFRDLDKANHAFKTGRYAIAANLYRDILSLVKVSSGIKYNYGMACERMGENRLSAKAWQSSIQDCGNYAPAYEKLRDIYCRSGDTASLAKLDKVFVWSYWQACPLKSKEILDGASFEP